MGPRLRARILFYSHIMYILKIYQKACTPYTFAYTDDVPSLNVLEEVFADITDWNGLGRCLRLHRSIRNDIKKHYPTANERKTAVLKHYIDFHPSPSLTEALWCVCIGSGDDYNNPEAVKQQKSLQKLYNERHFPGKYIYILYSYYIIIICVYIYLHIYICCMHSLNKEAIIMYIAR